MSFFAAATACHSGTPRPALATGSVFTMGITAVPGDQWVLNLPNLDNTSGMPLTIRSISIRGAPNYRSVVSVRGIWIAPRDKVSNPDWVPGGVFETLPPSFEQFGRCYVQRLVAPAGFVIEPGAEHRVAIWMEATGVGRFHVIGPVVTYTQAGHTFHQLISTGIDGTVGPTEHPFHPNGKGERACMNPENALPLGSFAP